MRSNRDREVSTGKRVGAFLLCLMLIVITGGCLGARVSPPSPQVPPAILVDYHRTGGIAGFNDRLVIFDNGAAVISGRTNRDTQLNRTDLARLAAIFTDAQFSSLEGNYTARHGSADLFHYAISYHGKTVNAEDSALPPSLQPVIDELNRILTGGGGAGGLVSGPFGGIPTL